MGERRAGPAPSLGLEVPQAGTAYPGGLLSGRASRCPLLRGTAAPLRGSAQHLRQDQSAQRRLLRLPRAVAPGADATLSQVMPSLAAQPEGGLLQWGEG